ncbi:hypothetical protein JCM3766R1_000234 [Sporobolomyces carnicolor]
MAAACVPTPISTVYETTTLTSLVPTISGSTTYVLVDPQAETVSTTFRTRDGVLEPVRTTILGATITTTEALTVTETSLVVTSVPVSTIISSCPVPPTPSSSTTTSSTTTSSTTTSSTTTSSTTTSSTSTTTSTTPTSTSTSSSSLVTSSSQTSSLASSSSIAASSSTGLLPSNASNASGSSSSSPSNLAAIIGGSVGGGVGAIILLGLLFWCCCGRNRRKNDDADEWRDPQPFLVSTGNAHGGSGEFEEKEATNGGRWDPASGHSAATAAHGNSRLSRKYVGAGAGAALAGGVSAYEAAGASDSHRRKSGKFRPADEQDAYYRNTWVGPSQGETAEPSRRPEPPVSAGFAGVGAGRAPGAAASRNVPPPQRQGTFANMMDNATNFDPRARDGGWAVANEAFAGPSAGPSGQAQFQPRHAMPPPAPLPLPGIDYRPNVDQHASAAQSTDAFLVPPSQSRFNRYNSPSHVQAGAGGEPSARGNPHYPQTNGYDSPAPSHVSIPALGPYHASSGASERGGNQLRVTNFGSSTQAGSDWGSPHDDDARARQEVLDDNDPYGGLDAGLDHDRTRPQRY